MMINIFTIVTTIFFSYLHPFHVSVCDVDFKEESKSIQVSQRIFLDDLEKALNEKYDINIAIDDMSTEAYRDSIIHVYLFETLNLIIDGKVRNRNYIGNEIEEDAMWCYIEYEGIKTFKTLEMTNRVLLETFDDQANIVHFSYGESEKSVKLDKLNFTTVFMPEE